MSDLRPYAADDHVEPSARSCPITAVVLTKDEERNLDRCLSSLTWCKQVLVVDSGSTDQTIKIAESHGVVVLHREWQGFAAQRQWALDHPTVDHDWVFFVDADEWVSSSLAREVSERVPGSDAAAFSLQLRLIFLGRWIRHCGWYNGSRVVRVLHRERAEWGQSEQYAERAQATGRVEPLENDIVDDDQKGLAAWMTKHVRYAELEAMQRIPADNSVAGWRQRQLVTTAPVARSLAKHVVFPRLPFKSIALFVYMYVLRAGWRDGRVGLTFCLLHAWHEYSIGVLVRSRKKLLDPAYPSVTSGKTLNSQSK